MGASGAGPGAMSSGVTFDTGALIAFESGRRRMAVLVEEAAASDTQIAIPAGVLAQAWREEHAKPVSRVCCGRRTRRLWC